MTFLGLDESLARLNSARPDADYYAVTLLGENGKMIWGMQSRWDGWTNEEPPRELRVPRLVTSKFGELWESVKQPYAVIHEPDEMLLFWMGGGNALVEKSLFDAGMSRYLEPAISIPDGAYGFASPEMFEKSAFKRAPTPKLRMQVLNRDKRRCRICGRQPDDDVDIQLHVHHIRTWAKGGVTEMGNLITLCHTCHLGLDPHQDISLFSYIEPKKLTPDIKADLEKFLDGVAEYRRIVRMSEIVD